MHLEDSLLGTEYGRMVGTPNLYLGKPQICIFLFSRMFDTNYCFANEILKDEKMKFSN